METKNLTIETLSPIFIWKGEDYSKFDYTSKPFNNNYESLIKIYDVEKLISDLGKYFNENEIFEILDYIEKNMKENKNFEIIEYLKSKNNNIPFKKYLIKQYRTKIKDFAYSKKDIKQFIHQSYYPYIPGSSIKGAINTALLYDKLKILEKSVIEKILNFDEVYPNKLVCYVKKKLPKDTDKLLNIINVSDNKNRYYILDSFFNENMLEIFLVNRFYVYHTNEKNIGRFKSNKYNKPIKIFIEGLKPYQTINLKIKCNENSFDEIKNACNELSLKICKWEISVLKKYKEKGKMKKVYNDLIEFYKNLSEYIEKYRKKSNNAFFLNIGWGGGYLPKTLYLLANEKEIDFNMIKEKLNTKYKEKLSNYEEFPFTRSITKYFNTQKNRLVNYPLGWIKIEG